MANVQVEPWPLVMPGGRHQFTRWLRRLPVDPDTSLNLLAGEWSAG